MELFFGYLNLLLSCVGRLILSEFIVTDEVISERVGIHTADKGVETHGLFTLLKANRDAVKTCTKCLTLNI